MRPGSREKTGAALRGAGEHLRRRCRLDEDASRQVRGWELQDAGHRQEHSGGMLACICSFGLRTSYTMKNEDDPAGSGGAWSQLEGGS